MTIPVLRRLAGATARGHARSVTGVRREISSVPLAPFDPEHEQPDDAILRAADTLHSVLGPDARDELILRLLAARATNAKRSGLAPNIEAAAYIPDDYEFETSLPVWPDDLLLPEVSVQTGADGVEIHVAIDRRRAHVRRVRSGEVEVTWSADGDAGPELTLEQMEAADSYLRAMYDRADQVAVEIEIFAFDSVKEKLVDALSLA